MLEEIAKITQYPDRRIKAIVSTVCSSRIRVGAWDDLRWGNIQPIQREGKIIAANRHTAGKIHVNHCYNYYTAIHTDS
jgi:hypothetical protein